MLQGDKVYSALGLKNCITQFYDIAETHLKMEKRIQQRVWHFGT